MNNLLRGLLASLACCVLFAGAAQAQVNRQDNEVAASASLFQSLRGGPPQLTVGFHYGHMVNPFKLGGTTFDGLQLGGDAFFTGALDFSSFASLTLFPQARYYLTPKDPRITPYVGVGLGLSVFTGGGNTSTNFAYDLNGGLKYFLNPTTAAFAQLDLTGPVTDPGGSVLIATAGLSIFF